MIAISNYKLTIGLLVILMSITALFPQATPGLEYTLIDNDTAYEVGIGDATEAHIVIPASHNGLPVTRIADEGFMVSEIMSVVIPNSVTSIGEWAFWVSTSLTSVTFSEPSRVATIGDYAFGACFNLTSIVIPSSVVSIGAEAFHRAGLTSVIFSEPSNLASIAVNAFYECLNLESVVIPSSVIYLSGFTSCGSLTSVAFSEPSSLLTIGTNAFMNTGIRDIQIPHSVTTIEENAFGSTWNLTSLEIPSSVTSISDRAFQVSSITSIVIPNSVISIGEEVFYGSSLTSVIFSEPSNITNITDGMFSRCGYLTSIEIPHSVTHIGSEAFSYCQNLTSIVIPSSVTSIGASAFSDCLRLSYIVIPNSVTSIGNNALGSCGSLAVIFAEAESQPAGWDANWNPDNRPVVWGYDPNIPVDFALIFLLIDDGTAYAVSKGPTMGPHVEIPATYNDLPVTQILDYGFRNSGILESVIIPNSVVSIGEHAFEHCINLTSIVIPNGVISIGRGAFFYCNSVTSIYISNSVVSIATGAFNYCSENLETIFVEPDNPYFRSEGNCLIDNSENVLLLGNKNSIIPDNVISIGDYAFAASIGLQSIEIPNSITSIGESAFDSCFDLTSIEIPNNVTRIGASAFAWCNNLTSIQIPNGITTIEHRAFRETGLTHVELPNSVVIIDQEAFYGTNLTSIDIPNNVTSIGMAAFAYTPLTSVNFGNSLTIIDEHAFAECDNLISIVIPSSVTNIRYGAFWFCRNLTSVVISSGQTNIERFAFAGCNNLTEVIIDIGEEVDNDASFFVASEDARVRSASIGDNAFSQCSSLTSINFSNNITAIGNSTFSYCYSLTSIYIPSSVTSIGDMAFYDCFSLTIYAEASAQPDGWHINWNPNNRPVVWGATSEEDEPVPVMTTKLSGNYPNPFNPETTINFSMSKAGKVTIDIFNIKGQKVKTLLSGNLGSGNHQIVWNGTDDNGRQVGSGIYFYNMQTNDYRSVKRMVLMK